MGINNELDVPRKSESAWPKIKEIGQTGSRIIYKQGRIPSLNETMQIVEDNQSEADTPPAEE